MPDPRPPACRRPGGGSGAAGSGRSGGSSPCRSLMTWVVALASAGYSKLIQLVMTAFQAQSPAVLWWGPLGVIGLSCANAVGQYLQGDHRQPR